jgi:tetratricopeptide (TPR) repeat protein
MANSKMVDEIIVDLDFPKDKRKHTLFVVFSSKEPHFEIAIDNIERVMKDQYSFDVVRLDASLKSEDSQFTELTNFLSTCAFAIVILDGFRPNVLFEYGILKGLGKPCIVLLENEATIDIKNYHVSEADCPIPNPKIDMDKHFSDIKDRYYVRYNKLDPKGMRTIISKEYNKLRDDIEKEFIRTIFPNREDFVNTLRSELNALSTICMKDDKSLIAADEENMTRITAKIGEIAEKNNISLPAAYYFAVAQVYEALNKDEVALKLIEPHIGGAKKIWRFLAFKAHLLRKLDRVSEALSIIEQAITYRQENESLWHNKALLLERLGRKKDAMDAYKTGISYNKNCSTIHFSYGVMLFESKKSKMALEQFESALKLSVDDSTYLLWKGKALYEMGDKPVAREIVEKAANIKPDNANAWFTLGLWEQDKTRAITFFDNAIKANPNHCGALCSKGAELSNSGKFGEAFEIMWAIRNKCPRHKDQTCSTLMSNLLATASRMDKKPSNEQMVEIFATLKGDKPELIGLRAMALATQGKFEEAFRLFNSAIKRTPKNATIWYNQACAYALSGDKNKALYSLKQAIILNPTKSKDALEDRDFETLYQDRDFLELTDTATSNNHKRPILKKKNARKIVGQKRQPTAPARNARNARGISAGAPKL